MATAAHPRPVADLAAAHRDRARVRAAVDDRHLPARGGERAAHRVHPHGTARAGLPRPAEPAARRHLAAPEPAPAGTGGGGCPPPPPARRGPPRRPPSPPGPPPAGPPRAAPG